MEDHNCHCKDVDPCCNRAQGEQGVQGIQGPRGQDGRDGLQGPQGQQGMQGIPGSCVNCNGSTPPATVIPNEFAESYSSVSQTLAPSLAINQAGDAVKLENLKFATANIDASQAPITGEYTVNLAGWYDVAAGITGTLNPIPSPLPVFTVSLFQNNIIVPGSTFSNVALSPAQQSNEITADTFVHLNKGDKIKLANTSIAPIFLSAPTLGTNAQTNSAYMKIQLLKADSTPSGNPLIDAANVSFITALLAANLSVVAGTAVNLSQAPADATAAALAATNALSAANAANTALIAASSFATVASVAAASTASANLLTASNAALVAANNAVTTLNPGNTALLVSANATASSAAALLAAAQLVAL